MKRATLWPGCGESRYRRIPPFIALTVILLLGLVEVSSAARPPFAHPSLADVRSGHYLQEHQQLNHDYEEGQEQASQPQQPQQQHEQLHRWSAVGKGAAGAGVELTANGTSNHTKHHPPSHAGGNNVCNATNVLSNANDCEVFFVTVASVNGALCLVAFIQFVRLRLSGLPRWIPEPLLHLTVFAFCALRMIGYTTVYVVPAKTDALILKAILTFPTSLLFLSYTLLLWHWASTYHSAASPGAFALKWVGRAIIFFNVAFFLYSGFLVYLSYQDESRLNERIVYDVVMVVTIVGMAGAFGFYGGAVTLSLKSYSQISEPAMRTMRQLGLLTVLCTAVLIGIIVVAIVALAITKKDNADQVYFTKMIVFRASEVLLCVVFMYTARPFNRRTGIQSTMAYRQRSGGSRSGYAVLPDEPSQRRDSNSTASASLNGAD